MKYVLSADRILGRVRGIRAGGAAQETLEPHAGCGSSHGGQLAVDRRRGLFFVKVAPTLCVRVIETTQGAVPEQAPLHPANVEVLSGVAVSVTEVPRGKVAVHAEPQSIPCGALFTTPRPVPVVVTASA